MQPTIDYVKASDGSGNASLMTVQSVRAPGATTILVNTVLGAPTRFYGSMGTPNTFTDPITGETITVISEATAVDFAGHIDGGNVEIDKIADGYTDIGSQVGDIIVIRPVTEWANLVAEFLAPTGAITEFAGSTAPEYWLLCDGSAVSRTDYSRLFDVVGTTFGVGDGTDTFNVPDLRSRSPIGVGTGTFSFTFTNSDVNISNEQITVAANEELITGRKVQLTTDGTLPTGLSLATDYYVIKVDATHIQLATSLANAVAGTAINITAAGSGTNTATGTLTARTLGQKIGEENHALRISESPAHSHSTTLYKNGASSTDGRFSGHATSGSGVQTAGTGTPGESGGSGEHNIMSPGLGLNYIIKT